MNTRAITAIIRKDLQVAMQNKGVVLPVIVVPLVMFVFIPWLLGLVPQMAPAGSSDVAEMEEMLKIMPPGLKQELAGYTLEQSIIVFFLVYMLAPMFLILPLMVSSVLAADSFAGEKERKTLEALLYTPVSDAELFTAKMLGPWIAALVVALGGFVLYAVNANAAGWASIGKIFFPNLMWIVLMLWVVPAVSWLGMIIMVFVSARAQGFQDAYQMGGMVVLPVLLLVFGQISGVMYFSVGAVLLLGLVVWLVNAGLLWLARRRVSRGMLMAKF